MSRISTHITLLDKATFIQKLQFAEMISTEMKRLIGLVDSVKRWETSQHRPKVTEQQVQCVLWILTGSLSHISSSVIVSPCPGIRAPNILMRMGKDRKHNKTTRNVS